MIRTVKRRFGVAELKARLSHYLREVKKGRAVEVLEHKTSVARLVPPEARPSKTLVIQEPTLDIKDVVLPRPVRTKVSSLELLLQDRRRGR